MLNAGSLGDLLGRKRVFVGGVVLFTVASALCGAATSPLFLNLARGVQGIGGAIMFAISLAIISQEFHGRERGTAFGIWGATRRRGGRDRAARRRRAHDLGRLALDLLRQPADRRRLRRRRRRELHESRDEEHGGFDLPGLVTFSGSALRARARAAARQRLGLGQRPRWSGCSPPRSCCSSRSRWSSCARSAPMFDLALFRVPSFAGAQIVAFTISASMFSQFLYLTLYIQNVLGYSPIGAGLRFLPLSLLSFVVAPIAGRLSARMPVRFLLGGGLALVGVALLLMHGITPGSGWTTLLAGLPRRRHRRSASSTRRSPRPRSASSSRGAGRDGVGDQQHVPPGRDRDRDRRARRDLPEQDPARARRHRCRVAREGGVASGRSTTPRAARRRSLRARSSPG